MAVPRVRIHQPPGERACGDLGRNTWVIARDQRGATPWWDDVTRVRNAMPSDESKTLFMAHISERMKLAEAGRLPWDLVDLMRVAPDVLRIELPNWWYSGGMMMTRLYFSEPHAVPGQLVALRLRFKRPGPMGLDDQDDHAREASDLLLDFAGRGYA